jgi:tyrosyl-DNA phosphodiesterase 1
LRTADFRNMTNAVYLTELLPLKDKDTPTSAFETALLDYFKFYGPSRTAHLVSRLSQHDLTSVKAHFVASVPGKFTGDDRPKWGLSRLQFLLKTIPCSTRSELIAQVPTLHPH